MSFNQQTAHHNQQTANQTETVLRTENLDIYYGKFLAVKGVNLWTFLKIALLPLLVPPVVAKVPCSEALTASTI
jgi:hypothetical protein